MEANGGRRVIQFHHEAAEQQHADRSILVAWQRVWFNDQLLVGEFEAGKGNGHTGP